MYKIEGRHNKSRKLSGLNATKDNPYSPDGTFNRVARIIHKIGNRNRGLSIFAVFFADSQNSI
jgi:hypothetical protein